MARPPVIPVDDKQRIVLSVVSGEMTVAEAARRNKVDLPLEAAVPRGW
jgi:transposase